MTPISKGGLGVIDIKFKTEAIMLRHLQRVLPGASVDCDGDRKQTILWCRNKSWTTSFFYKSSDMLFLFRNRLKSLVLSEFQQMNNEQFTKKWHCVNSIVEIVQKNRRFLS